MYEGPNYLQEDGSGLMMRVRVRVRTGRERVLDFEQVGKPRESPDCCTICLCTRSPSSARNCHRRLEADECILILGFAEPAAEQSPWLQVPPRSAIGIVSPSVGYTLGQ